MRTPLIAGNWKMNTTLPEAVKLVKEIRPLVAAAANVEILVCPPFISLSAVSDALQGSRIKIGAQNLHDKDSGAYTGEISGPMLVGLAEYVIIGHSERRQYFAEDGGWVNAKIKAAQRHGIKPILCVGETLEQNQAGQTEAVLQNQLAEALVDIDPVGLVIAYEPIWAIGTGLAATSQQANQTISFIRGRVAALMGASVAEGIRILYGGSVKPDNAAELFAQPEIDGALVGGACLAADSFAAIVKAATGD
jgi:triosephosphate isomerase (TIM)